MGPGALSFEPAPPEGDAAGSVEHMSSRASHETQQRTRLWNQPLDAES